MTSLSTDSSADLSCKLPPKDSPACVRCHTFGHSLARRETTTLIIPASMYPACFVERCLLATMRYAAYLSSHRRSSAPLPPRPRRTRRRRPQLERPLPSLRRGASRPHRQAQCQSTGSMMLLELPAESHFQLVHRAGIAGIRDTSYAADGIQG